MKFGTLQHMLNPIAVTWPKIKRFKIEDGGDRHLENRDITVKLLLDFDKIWCTTAYIKPNKVLKALSQYLRCGKDVIR